MSKSKKPHKSHNMTYTRARGETKVDSQAKPSKITMQCSQNYPYFGKHFSKGLQLYQKSSLARETRAQQS